MHKVQLIMDIECYVNYFLVMFYNPKNGSYLPFERTADKELDVERIRKILDTCEIVTFNGINYDIPVLSAAMRGWDNANIREVSDAIIGSNLKYWQIERQYGPNVTCDHIDLFEVAPGQASLKIYGGRLACPKLQDLPIEPNAILTRQQMDTIALYCRNDVLTTAALAKKLEQQIDLRRTMSDTYGKDLRSKSDAQIAEAVIVSEIEKLKGCKLPKTKLNMPTFVYEPPEFLTTIRPEILDALQNPFVVKGNGVTEMPKQLEELKITIGESTYQMGMGGLHSTEKSCYHVADEDTLLADWDVASYYPAIILNCELYPPTLGRDFLDVYKTIVDERLEAKKIGNKVKADSLKIVVNGTYGKLGSKYSALYAPNHMVQVTVTGQLSLLMLIEWLEKCGISVVSGNTDGIVIKCPKAKEALMQKVIGLWEKQTGFTMERNDYSALYSRDVNNYIAITTGGKVKTKGCFAFAGLQKNPTNEICTTAVIDYLKDGVPIEKTIMECNDITKFLTIRTVKGGGVYGDLPLGKAVRWYYGKDSDKCIQYKSDGKKVARSDGAVPLMDLPDTLPTDIDYLWYINESYDLLKDLGVQ